MSRLLLTLTLCVALLVASPVTAKTTSIDAGALEAKWQSYSNTAAQTQPAMQFPYEHCFRRAAAAHQLPETLLLAVARGESDFKPRARSHANAYGLMQILWPGTAKHLGLNRLSDLLEPCTNVEAGTRYLKELLERYQGNMHRALAAYNYGPSRIPVSGGKLPDGAVWYSNYILRHLDYVLNGSRKQPRGSAPGLYSDQDRLFIIRFARPYRAAAFVDSLQPGFGDIRLDWFQRPDKGFDVVMLYASEKELQRGQQLLSAMGLSTMQRELRPLLLFCTCGITGAANAEAFQTYATVVDVQPIVETVYQPVTRRVCTDPDDASREFTELSATIGEDVRHQNRLWQAHRSCKTITEKQARERVTAYRVTYRYRGYTSTTRLSHPPGDRMPVNVSLSPLP